MRQKRNYCSSLGLADVLTGLTKASSNGFDAVSHCDEDVRPLTVALQVLADDVGIEE